MSDEEGGKFIHAMGHQKLLLRTLQGEGVEKVIKGNEISWSNSTDSAVCFIHLTNGCTCGAAWRVLPRSYLSIVGGKVSMTRLLRSFRQANMTPTTFVNFSEYMAGKAAEEVNGPIKWFVKVSHMNSRKCMLCSTQEEEIRNHIASFPGHYKYVIQKEVQNPMLIDGYKILLRLWVLLIVNNDGTVSLHFSRRMRINRLRSRYDADNPSTDGDLKHQGGSIFSDAQKWEHYPKLWGGCVETADSLLRMTIKKWETCRRMTFPKAGGLFNIFAMDYVPTNDVDPVLIEANVDPGFQHKCVETKGAADDFANFFFLPMLNGEALTVPNPNFLSREVDCELVGNIESSETELTEASETDSDD
eukprot:TRINITY_DN6961_c2_g1_i1.p1 TRINITY_DN6961_c2_g1~~TRINITY_DN6961_c2_g1_i1.p1  ORF type:complete len:359 (+),score=63.60 TRINITY_DN6961_c2_g1_i1:193-1269(+)